MYGLGFWAICSAMTACGRYGLALPPDDVVEESGFGVTRAKAGGGEPANRRDASGRVWLRGAFLAVIGGFDGDSSTSSLEGWGPKSFR